jgi:hypothetical protein
MVRSDHESQEELDAKAWPPEQPTDFHVQSDCDLAEAAADCYSYILSRSESKHKRKYKFSCDCLILIFH